MIMKKYLISCCLIVAGIYQAKSFCGFYVAKADAKLFNKSSQVILVRDGEHTVITMSNDFQGSVKDFAMVIPVPVVLKENNIRIAERSVFDKLDAYSGPRLVEYYDANPCQQYYVDDMVFSNAKVPSVASAKNKEDAAINKKDKYQVTIEAKYTVGEYDILILSAKESTGLKDWLTDNGYKIPSTAAEVLDPYIKSNLKFFVVKVNLEKQKAEGFSTLRPLQIDYDSPKFMLPIRLGMANANGAQDMIVYAFTRTGRVECTNYRTVKIPTDRNIPLGIKKKFGDFYVSLFNKAYKHERKNCVFLEYSWNVTPSFGGMKCDPCVGPPPIFAELKEAGVKWVENNNSASVFFTRLHVRYTRDNFPQDLLFQVTPNNENFQARYILTNPANSDFSCDAAQQYLKDLTYRRKREVEELAALTNWSTTAYNDYIYEYVSKIKDDEFKKNDFTPVIPDADNFNSPDDNFWKKILFSLGLVITALFSVILFSMKTRPVNS